MYGGFLYGDTQFSDRDVDENVTTILAAGQETSAVIMDSTTSALLDGFVITGGNAAEGGGVHILSADDTNTIQNCIITGNTSTSGGGGLYMKDSDTAIVDCVILGNVTAYGGGLQLYQSGPMITDCIFSGNTASVYGGATYIQFGASDPVFTNCTFSGNTASNNGGAHYWSNGAFVEMINCIVSGNSTISRGGGFYINGANPVMTNCTIAGNTSGGDGGGMYLFYLGTPDMTNCIFYSNSNHAIYESGADTDVDLTNCLFYNNADGDYYDFDTTTSLTTAGEIDTLAEASSTTDGDPSFTPGANGNWNLLPSYDSAANTTTLTDTTGTFAEDELVNLLINVDTEQSFEAIIVSNTDSSITVVGDVTDIAKEGDESFSIQEYHITYQSDAIDKGTDINAPDTDIDGETRPYNIDDIGVDEWGYGDTDGDGIEDGVETNTYNSNPTRYEVWLDIGWTGSESGSPTEPYNTLEEALLAVPLSGGIRINGASSEVATPWSASFESSLHIDADGGAVEIGATP